MEAAIKPLIASPFGPINVSDVVNIANVVLKCEAHILDHEDVYSSFYVAFAVLSADHISSQCSQVTHTQYVQFSEAVTVILRYILKYIESVADSSKRYMLLALRSLCDAKSHISSSDHAVLVSIIKNATHPDASKINSLSPNGSEKENSKVDTKRSRFDLSSTILQQLITPLTENSLTWAPTGDEAVDFSASFISHNRSYFQNTNAEELVLNICTTLPTLARYRLKYEESIAQGVLYLPQCITDAISVKHALPNMMSDMSILSATIAIDPIIDTMSPKKITQLTQSAMAALYCAVLASSYGSVLNNNNKSNANIVNPSANVSNPSTTALCENETPEETARNVVSTALDIFTTVANILKKTTRSNILCNHYCSGAWLIISGLQGALGCLTKQQMAFEDTKGRSPSRCPIDLPYSGGRMNLFKIQQCFGVLHMAIVSQCITILSELFDDLSVEVRSCADITSGSGINVPESAGFDILEPFTALQRIMKVFQTTCIPQLFTFLGTIAYRKACTLRRVNTKVSTFGTSNNNNEDDPVSFSDSATYLNETIICSEDSETEEDDSDSYLGLWFKEQLSPEVKDETQQKTVAGDSNDENNQTIVAAKDEPHEYLEMASQIFAFMDLILSHSSGYKYLSQYMKNGLNEQQVMLMANILKDLDRDNGRIESEGGNNKRWKSVMDKFAGVLGKYLHNLISNDIINEHLQSALLLHLGVSPWTYDLNIWPLQVYPRTLTVLVQIILMKPLQEKEAACLSVWHRLVNTLVEGVCVSKVDNECEDLNVEHAQLLLYLFHSLNLMQKKSILLLTAGGVTRCAEICRNVTADKPLKDGQIILLCRLLTFLEYLMKHLYNAPNILLEQVRWNLFSVISSDASKAVANDKKAKVLSFSYKHLEEKFRKWNNDAFTTNSPKFYSLTPIEQKLQQDFKLDGLAWNFLLCTPDKLKYQLLVDSLTDILSIVDISKQNVQFPTLCIVQYCFGLAWKLLSGLPPSSYHIERFLQTNVPNLHSLIWSVRCQSPNQEYLIENSLIKQGMHTEEAKALWKKTTTHVSQIEFSTAQTLIGLDNFCANSKSQIPKLSRLILVDGLISQLITILGQNGQNSSKAVPSTESNNTPLAIESNQLNELSKAMYETGYSNSLETLIERLLDTIEIMSESLFIVAMNMLGERPSLDLIGSIISISNAENQFCPEMAVHLLHFLSSHDIDVNIWSVELKLINDGNIPANIQYPVEYHILQVVEGHITEISNSSSFSIYPYLAHALKSAIKLLNTLIVNHNCELREALLCRMKDIIIPLIFDMRSEFVYKLVIRTTQLLFGEEKSSENYQLMAYTYVLRHSYQFIMSFSEQATTAALITCTDETIIDIILQYWETLFEKQMGIEALHHFFYVSKEGNLVDLLLNFSTYNSNPAYSTRILQFFEKLFQTVEKRSSHHLLEISTCLSELANVDPNRIQIWLRHILLGNNGNLSSYNSNYSSNINTPTNTISNTTSINPASRGLEVEDGEVDADITSSGFRTDNNLPSSANEMVMILENSGMLGGNGQPNWPVQQPQACTSMPQTDGITQEKPFCETTNQNMPTPNDYLAKNGRLLQSIVKYIVTEQRLSKSVSSILFSSMMQISSNLLCPTYDAIHFKDILLVMITLADASEGKEHSVLFGAVIEWMDILKSQAVDAVTSDPGKISNLSVVFENLTSLLKYIVDLLHGLDPMTNRKEHNAWEEDHFTMLEEIFDDVTQDDDDSTLEDSDEDSLGNRLCTYSITQKEFMNQHWYHCHTCKMVDGVGVCSVCARVCHRAHDLSYAKYGNFFCDCGAKEDSSCLAMTKRNGSTSGFVSVNSVLESNGVEAESTRRHMRSPTPPAHSQKDMIQSSFYLLKTIDAAKETLLKSDKWRTITLSLLNFIRELMPAIKENCAKYSSVGCHLRAKNAMERLHLYEKSFHFDYEIMTPSVGTQESAFENVRISYSGEQGQTIRQLISTNLVRRVTLCCMASTLGKRQHLAVALEKGKILIFQLSMLLKQDSSKRKLTLNRLASAPINCTVLSMAANPVNEDYLAVCGLKECHVLSLTSNGTVKEHIVLTPQLETGNFIKRAIWLPSSQTKLALITAEFVKIYDLSKDSYSPEYYFLLPNGKIRDCTFLKEDKTYYMLLMASSGYIYTQPLTHQSLATHGPFYVVETLQLDHPLIKQMNNQLGGGGASIYYSSTLEILFFSYTQGRSFMAPLSSINEGIKKIVPLQIGVNTKNSSKGPAQPLCQWTEIPGHPGLICSMMQTSNNPVIFMVKPEAIFVQEIKATSAKAKIMDMVAIRHSVYGNEKTTLILLCEDGNLRIHTANVDTTNYWMSPEIKPQNDLAFPGILSKVCKKKMRNKNNQPSVSTGGNNNRSLNNNENSTSSTFPIDFFEHCTVMSDIEFGGNHLLQIYNSQLLKHRLSSTGLYVASTRMHGFTLDVINNDPNMVITGFRILIGSQSTQRAPLNVVVHGRMINTIALRPRWFDIPLTWEESLLSDKKLSISFGPSQDQDDITMLDSIKIYGKTKDIFGWPEEAEDMANATGITPANSVNAQNNQLTGTVKNANLLSNGNDRLGFASITSLDKMLSTILEVIDSSLSLMGGFIVDDTIKQNAKDIATNLLIRPTPTCIQNNAKSVLSAIFNNRQQFHSYKDYQILRQTYIELRDLNNINDTKEIDPEAFFRLMMLIRGIAVTRPHSIASICKDEQYDIVPLLMEMVKKLHNITPKFEESDPIVKRGLSHAEQIVSALVEIIYAFAFSQSEYIASMTEHLVNLLLDTSVVISHTTKQVMIKLLRPRVKRRKPVQNSPPICSTPTPSSTSVVPVASATNEVSNSFMEPQASGSLNDDGDNSNENVYNQIIQEIESNPNEEVVEMGHEVDDVEFLEIAIAMSLQDQDPSGPSNAVDNVIVNLQALRGRALQRLQTLNSGASGSVEATRPVGEQFQDPNPSGPGSDDEVSNAATDGSTLRISPAEQAGSVGSESGGSGVESIGGVSERSCTFGDQSHPTTPKITATTGSVSNEGPVLETNQPNLTVGGDSCPNSNIENDGVKDKLHILRCSILENMVDKLDKLDNIRGIHAIPFMQIIHLLAMDLDSEEMGQRVMNKLLSSFIKKLEMVSSSPASEMRNQSPKTEVQWLILRMFSVFMGKVKSSSKSSTASTGVTSVNASGQPILAAGSYSSRGVSHQSNHENTIFLATMTANALMKSGAIPYSLLILESFLPYWTNISHDEDSAHSNKGASTHLLEPTQYGPVPDMMPFYISQKGCNNPYESYPALITEIAMKLLYQILKLSSGQPSTYDWNQSICEYMTYVLCEYMMYWQTQSLRRQVRKLLLYICGNKEKYRRMRDIHALNTHMKAVKKCSDPNLIQTCGAMAAPILSYDGLVELTEHLKACQEIASVRTGNWQLFCFIHSDILPSLLKISCQQLDDGISPIILQLLQSALCSSANGKPVGAVEMKALIRERKEREKSEESETIPNEHKFDPLLCTVLAGHIFTQVPPSVLTKFIKNFLLETNSSHLRWQAHSLIFAFYENANSVQREQLLTHLWDLWPHLSAYGRRTAQFVDIIGYLTLNIKTSTQLNLQKYSEDAVAVLRQQNELIMSHPNARIYSALSQVLQIDGFYLESEPCLVCNLPEVPMTNIKLTSIKIDSKFTTTNTLVKLVYSHTISKINLRIADLKRTKMVKTINIYYNNRTVQAIVELKNRPSMWHKARRVSLANGQTEVKIEFPLPITACNLMIEYVDFYETQTGSNENLQCPRCSAAVPANPGVCGNCGENVFQCHKCRAINYDEKDPFLCHSCGFCKYAKFDYTIYGRVCCAVDPIESAEDRAKTVQLIYTLLGKADLLYRQLQINKEYLELLLQKNIDERVDLEDLFNISGATQINKIIQMLSQKYCVESKASFDDLSKIIQKVQASRKELVAYDRAQLDIQTTPVEFQTKSLPINRCYGCALASTEQCLTLLRALASNPTCQAGLCKQGLVEELASNNLRKGTPQIQSEVRSLLCLLTKNNLKATRTLCNLIQSRVSLALNGSMPLANLDIAVHHEMNLLMSLVANEDEHWEEKLRAVFELFTQACKDSRGSAVIVIQPCFKIIESLIAPMIVTMEHNNAQKSKSLSAMAKINNVTISYELWLRKHIDHSFQIWKKRMPRTNSSDLLTNDNTPASSAPNSPNELIMNSQFGSLLEQIRCRYRRDYLQEKYGKRWREVVLNKPFKVPPLQLAPSWLKNIFFNANTSLIRKLPYAVIDALCNSFVVKKELLNLFTSFLGNVCEAGEASSEFMTMYLSMAEKTPWRQYLVLRGVLITVTNLITVEIEKIHRLEETTVSSDLVQGFALHRLVDLLQMFLENALVLRSNKGKLLGPVLQGYLSLRKLVVQRTRLIDEAQEKLLEMLEEMTTGTNEETRDFMAILIRTVEKTPMNDIKTPVFIFERLCSIIHPEENDVEEFFMTLEKDQQQEDFLQGRMLGNPYPSSAPGLGPLMRDVKNKICTDCELVALLEDDNGMELLVHNKIISLELPVKDVYKKVWLADGGNRESMRIIYRMRGLLGDATEEFIETLNNKTQEQVDNEKLFKMANVLAECGGLRVMLDRIGSLQNISTSRPLLQVLLKLFLFSVKVSKCQAVLCQPELGAINTLLKVLQLCLQSDSDSQHAMVTEQLLEIMETILSKAASETLDSFLRFSQTFGGPEHVQALLSCTSATNVQSNQSFLRHLIRVLAALVYGNETKMAILCEHFNSVLEFVRFDMEHSPAEEHKMELFCVLTSQIEHNAIGSTLKNYIIGLGIVDRALEYIVNYAPQVKTTLHRNDSDELKEFMSRPSLKYILRFLSGLCTKHEATQAAVSKDIIPIIHQLEQVSSDEHIGCLAENLLEALSTDPTTAQQVQNVREYTRAEKKRLAMATREKQLDALGMRTNEKGQVTAKGAILQKIEKLRDETGLTCFICREGYACQPSKVLGIYTFTKRIHVEPYEIKRKTYGYTTVTHFNVVHIECHMSALRTAARSRDEWETASLHNANTRCNGLLPLWGPDVSESAFSSCMSRHNSYMQESTQRCEITFSSAIHDLKMLLNRFAFEKSFHEDAGGGGPQSNMHLIPYLLFYSTYILLSQRSFSREEKTLSTFLGITSTDASWLDNAYEVEGPLYQATLSLALHTPNMWVNNRIQHLKRLLAIAHIRQVSPSSVCKSLSPSDREEKDYKVYKGYLMFWGLIDMIYRKIFKAVTTPREEDWPISLFDYLRRNDEALQKSAESLLKTFTEEYLPCTSFAEFCDVSELLMVIEEPNQFLSDLLGSLGSGGSVPDPSSTSA